MHLFYTTKNLMLLMLIVGFWACSPKNNEQATEQTPIQQKLQQYAQEDLRAELSVLTEREKMMIPVFIDISKIIDQIFLYQVIGPTNKCDTLTGEYKQFFEINYGPWDRFSSDKPFVDCFGKKSLGANFYPANMTIDEFEQWNDSLKYNPYTFIRRNFDGELYAIPYHQRFPDLIELIATKLEEASQIADNKQFKEYLQHKKNAIQTDNYFRADSAWIKLEDNTLDFVFGPIDVYEDQLLGIRADYQSFLLIKDKKWSQRLEKYTKWLKYLQKALPVPEEYRAEDPGLNSKIIASDVIYYGGSGQAGGAFLSINQPITPVINSLYGSKRIIFKNTTTAKFKHLLKPIAQLTLTEPQRHLVTGEAFFTNSVFYEVARGLGITKTIKSGQSVSEALKEYNNTIELAKANSLALFLVSKIHSVGEIQEPHINHYITYWADLLRAMRLSDESSQSKASVICYNFFRKHGAVQLDFKKQFAVDFKKMQAVNDSLARKIIMIQGDGDYNAAKKFVEQYGTINNELAEIITKIKTSKIPVDIYFNQGLDVLEKQNH